MKGKNDIIRITEIINRIDNQDFNIVTESVKSPIGDIVKAIDKFLDPILLKRSGELEEVGIKGVTKSEDLSKFIQRQGSLEGKQVGKLVDLATTLEKSTYSAQAKILKDALLRYFKNNDSEIYVRLLKNGHPPKKVLRDLKSFGFDETTTNEIYNDILKRAGVESNDVIKTGQQRLANAGKVTNSYLQALKKWPILGRWVKMMSKKGTRTRLKNVLKIGLEGTMYTTIIGTLWDNFTTSGDEMGFFGGVANKIGLAGTKILTGLIRSGKIHDGLKTLEKSLIENDAPKLVTALREDLNNANISFAQSDKIKIVLDKSYDNNNYFRFIISYPFNNTPQQDYILVNVVTGDVTWADTGEYVTNESQKTIAINNAIRKTTPAVENSNENIITEIESKFPCVKGFLIKDNNNTLWVKNSECKSGYCKVLYNGTTLTYSDGKTNVC